MGVPTVRRLRRRVSGVRAQVQAAMTDDAPPRPWRRAPRDPQPDSGVGVSGVRGVVAQCGGAHHHLPPDTNTPDRRRHRRHSGTSRGHSEAAARGGGARRRQAEASRSSLVTIPPPAQRPERPERPERGGDSAPSGRRRAWRRAPPPPLLGGAPGCRGGLLCAAARARRTGWERPLGYVYVSCMVLWQRMMMMMVNWSTPGAVPLARPRQRRLNRPATWPAILLSAAAEGGFFFVLGSPG